MKWFDRSFAFDQPAWMYPNVLERLRGTPARLEELVRSVPPEDLSRRQAGNWSVQENVGHLLDLEPLWSGRLDDILAGSERLRPADLTNRATHEADHNSADIGDILRSLRAARGAFLHRLDDLDASWVERSALHPRLEQPMRLLDLVFFVAEHDDHHLAEITRLQRNFQKM